MKSKLKIGTCTYCGESSSLTRDHVVPLCLFQKPYPLNLITVGVCENCNNMKSKNDQYLRDYLTMDIHGNRSAIAQDIFINKVMKSFRSKRSELLRNFLTEGAFISYHTKGGIYLGEFPSVPIDANRIGKIIFNIAQGMFFDHRKQCIPKEYECEVLRHEPWDFENVWESFKSLNINGPRILGEVFGCAYVSAEEDPSTTMWLIWFYKRVFFSAWVKNPNL